VIIKKIAATLIELSKNLTPDNSVKYFFANDVCRKLKWILRRIGKDIRLQELTWLRIWLWVFKTLVQRWYADEGYFRWQWGQK